MPQFKLLIDSPFLVLVLWMSWREEFAPSRGHPAPVLGASRSQIPPATSSIALVSTDRNPSAEIGTGFEAGGVADVFAESSAGMDAGPGQGWPSRMAKTSTTLPT